ncbi:FkbM family methyltransferase [Rheinheimera sp.]|uniref:FkbM family methyltransferase n=1 Tax=Rheinheimera sp. TaxID=1869214 RepID=UPI003AF8BDBD
MNLHPTEIYDIKLMINKSSADFHWYQQRGVFEERVSPLYSLIAKEEFTHFFDIGANYGYISLLVKKANRAIKTIAIEADPRLPPVIKENLILNDIHDVEIINAIASDHCVDNSFFSINPNSSLDNRVNMSDWQKVSVSSLTVDKLISTHCDHNSKVFLKIDTQGFEQFVLRGAEKSLSDMAEVSPEIL